MDVVKKNTSKLQEGFKKLTSRIKDTAQGFLTGMIAFEAIRQITRYLIDAVVKATEFSKQMAEISTLMDTATEESIEAMAESLRDMSTAYPIKTMEEMTRAMYQIISAGVELENQMYVMDTAIKASVAGIADLTSTINAIISVIKGYNLSFAEAGKVSDYLFLTVKLGITTFGELATAIGGVVPLAAALNIKMSELFAVFATFTGVTGSTAEVATQLESVMSSLIKPTGEMEALMEQLGYTSSEAMLAELGLVGSIERMTNVAGTGADVLGELFRRKEAITLVMALLGSQQDEFVDKMLAMNEVTGDLQITEAALQKIMEDESTQIQITKNQYEELKRSIGEGLLPILRALVSLSYGIANGFTIIEISIQNLRLSFWNLMNIALKVHKVMLDFIGMDTSHLDKAIEETGKKINEVTENIKEAMEVGKERHKKAVAAWNAETVEAEKYEAQLREIGSETGDMTGEQKRLFTEVKEAIAGTGDELYTTTNIPIGKFFNEITDNITNLQDEYSNLGDEIRDLNSEIGEKSVKAGEMGLKISAMQLKAREEDRDLTESEKKSIEDLQLSIDQERHQMDRLRLEKDRMNLERERAKENIDEENERLLDFLGSLEKEGDLLPTLIRQWNAYWEARRGEGGEIIPIPEEITRETITERKAGTTTPTRKETVETKPLSKDKRRELIRKYRADMGRGKYTKEEFEKIKDDILNDKRRYETGSAYISTDQVAEVHKGEAIIKDSSVKLVPEDLMTFLERGSKVVPKRKVENIKEFETGSRIIPEDMIALLHKNEEVIPAHKAKKETTPVMINNNYDLSGVTMRNEEDINKFVSEISKQQRKMLVALR